jgi:hypothetical protein
LKIPARNLPKNGAKILCGWHTQVSRDALKPFVRVSASSYPFLHRDNLGENWYLSLLDTSFSSCRMLYMNDPTPKPKVAPKIAALNARAARVKHSPEVEDWMRNHSVNDPRTTLQSKLRPSETKTP